jgi:hypothetical protein
MTTETTSLLPIERAANDALVRDLVNGLVHALPAIALGTQRQPDARTRAEEFARAFAMRRSA